MKKKRNCDKEKILPLLSPYNTLIYLLCLQVVETQRYDIQELSDLASVSVCILICNHTICSSHTELSAYPQTCSSSRSLHMPIPGILFLQSLYSCPLIFQVLIQKEAFSGLSLDKNRYLLCVSLLTFLMVFISFYPLLIYL